MYEGTNLTPHSDVDQESPQNTCFFFIFIAIPGHVTTMLLFSFFAFCYLPRKLAFIKNIHNYWLSGRIKPRLSYIASVIMSVMILQ